MAKSKIITFNQIVARNPSFSNPVKLSSSMLKKQLDRMQDHNSFEYMHSEVYVVGYKKENRYLDLIDRNGNRNYLYCSGKDGSYYYDSIGEG